MKISFLKMQATGNDFLVINSLDQDLPTDLGDLSHKMGDRRFGIGADQIVYIKESVDCDFQMLVYNADGSQAEMSGNGMRCFALALRVLGLTDKTALTIETLAGVIVPEVIQESADRREAVVRVNMGKPILFDPIDIEHSGFEALFKGLRVEGADLSEAELWVHRVSMGNPHAILLVNDVDAVPLEVVGPLVERHPEFPDRTNFEVVQIISKNQVKQRTWERGAEETLACGTGASAVAAVLNQTGHVTFPVSVALRGGEITVTQSDSEEIVQQGPAKIVFEGEYVYDI